MECINCHNHVRDVKHIEWIYRPRQRDEEEERRQIEVYICDNCIEDCPQVTTGWDWWDAVDYLLNVRSSQQNERSSQQDQRSSQQNERSFQQDQRSSQQNERSSRGSAQP